MLCKCNIHFCSVFLSKKNRIRLSWRAVLTKLIGKGGGFQIIDVIIIRKTVLRNPVRHPVKKPCYETQSRSPVRNTIKKSN